MAFKRSAVRSRLSPPKSPEILRFQDFFLLLSRNMPNYGAFSKYPFFHVASAQLPVPEFGLNPLKSCCTPIFCCNSSASIIHEHGARCQEDGLRFVIFPINDQCGSSDHLPPHLAHQTKPGGLLMEAAQHKYHTTPVFSCPFSVSPTFCGDSYGTSHLEKRQDLGYYEATKKE